MREQISTEQWHRLNSLYLEVTRPGLYKPKEAGTMAMEPEQPTEFLQQVMEAVHQFQGVSDSTMSHGEGWQFIQVGRYIERASATAMLLEAYHEDLWASRIQQISQKAMSIWTGWGCCAGDGVRGLLQGVYGGPDAGADSGIFAAG